MKRVVAFLFFFLVSVSSLFAQCAMCRTQLENNVSNGNPGLAAGLNTGILYLLSVPYLAVMALGYFWYKSSKKNESDKLTTGVSTR